MRYSRLVLVFALCIIAALVVVVLVSKYSGSEAAVSEKPSPSEAPVAPPRAVPASTVEAEESDVVAEEPQPPTAVQQAGAVVRGAETETPAPPRPVVVGDSAAQVLMREMTDVSTPVKEREKVLVAIAKKGDRASLDNLKSIADARVYMNFYAVDAMGNMAKSPLRDEASKYVRDRMSDPDSQIATAAIRAWGRLQGDHSIEALGETINANRDRPDGHNEEIATAAVTALQNTGSPLAVPVLCAELERSEIQGWSMEYGSIVIAALGAITTPEGRQAAAAYADRLEARIPDDPLAGPYFVKKIEEARKVAKPN